MQIVYTRLYVCSMHIRAYVHAEQVVDSKVLNFVFVKQRALNIHIETRVRTAQVSLKRGDANQCVEA